MTDDVVIRAEGLGKKYSVGHMAERGRYLALRDVLTRGAHNLWRKAAEMTRGRGFVAGDTIEEFWALKDVSFEVRRGEVLGIIGRNGAGKSTLLKILSRITEPTEGRVTINGRVASLLEVGTGFHPELTGRENIYLNGAILGMTRAEIRRKFDEIVSFAEIEKFLDTPVKRYSSGMYVRLAFAVAAHLEPEILIVDEVLAVGDMEFQKRCLGKMDEVSRREGRTVLLVTHQMSTVSKLCQEAIWLDRGSIREQDTPGTIITRYLTQGSLNSASQFLDLTDLAREFVEDHRVRLGSLEWLSRLPLMHGEPVKVRIIFEAYAPVAEIAVGIGFCDVVGRRILTYDTDLVGNSRPKIAQSGTYAVELTIEALPLQPDTYAIDIGCRGGDLDSLDFIPAAVHVEVMPGATTPRFISDRLAGVRLSGRWQWNPKDCRGLEAVEVVRIQATLRS